MPGRHQRGLGIVELLIGLAIGLFIVATALALLVGRIQDHRALLVQSRLTQDLRVAADIVTRDLRRAGYWGDAGAGVRRVGASALANPYTALAPSAAASDAVTFRFSRDASENQGVDANEQFGFRLRNGVIEMLLGAGNWQALTDSGTLLVTAFSITPTLHEISLAGSCSTPCPAGAGECSPRQLVRSLAVTISGRAPGNATVVRTVRGLVRLRNDAIVGNCSS